MQRTIRTIDRGRAKYYEFYTGMRWGDKVNYDLCINTTNANIKELAPHLYKGTEHLIASRTPLIAARQIPKRHAGQKGQI